MAILDRIAQGSNNAGKVLEGALLGQKLKQQDRLRRARSVLAGGEANERMGILGRMMGRTPDPISEQDAMSTVASLDPDTYGQMQDRALDRQTIGLKQAQIASEISQAEREQAREALSNVAPRVMPQVEQLGQLQGDARQRAFQEQVVPMLSGISPEIDQRLSQMSEQGVPDEEVRSLRGFLARATEAKQPTPTSAMKEAEALGYQPGTPEYEAYLRENSGRGDVNVDLGGLADKELIKDLGERRESINEAKQAALSVVRLGNRLSEQLDEGGAETIGPVGFLNRLGDSVKSQAQALSRSYDIPFDPDSFDFGNLDEAAQSAGARSNILSLAFNIARSREPGGRLSDTEVQQALNTIAASSGSVDQVLSSLNEVTREAVQGVDQRIAVERSAFEDSPVNAPTMLSEDLERLGLQTRFGREPEIELPEGAERVGEVDGKPVVRMQDGSLKVVE